MSESNETKQKKSGSPLAAGVILGAALGAAAVLLSNKKNQDKVANAMKKAKEWVNEKKDTVSDQMSDIADIEEESVKKTTRKKTNHTPRRDIN
jgi:uncharacterized membrane-anchored protein YhcB (DUF1043 family)